VIAGVDVGNATTEVVLVSGGKILGAGRAPTRGRKGSPGSLRGAAALVRRLERQAGGTVSEARIAPLRAVDTSVLTVPDAVPPSGRLRVLAAGVPTPGGTGVCVGPPLSLADPGPREERDETVVAVAPPGLGYEDAAARLRALLAAGTRIGAVLVAGDEGVLVVNRVPAALPVIDQLAVDGPGGWLPFDRRHGPGEWRVIRLRLKLAVLAANFRRAVSTLGQDPAQVLIVGGPAGDEELLGVIMRSLPDGVPAGRGDVGGTCPGEPLGHRYAVALGLALAARTPAAVTFPAASPRSCWWQILRLWAQREAPVGLVGKAARQRRQGPLGTYARGALAKVMWMVPSLGSAPALVSREEGMRKTRPGAAGQGRCREARTLPSWMAWTRGTGT